MARKPKCEMRFFFFFFFFWRGAKVNFQVNIHIIIQMVDEFVPSYVPFPMQLLLQSIYLLNIWAFMHILHTSHMNKIQLYIVLGHECVHVPLMIFMNVSCSVQSWSTRWYPHGLSWQLVESYIEHDINNILMNFGTGGSPKSSNSGSKYHCYTR